MKYYIYNTDGNALYWDEDVLEFDSYESALRFLESAKENSEHPEDFQTDAEITKDIDENERHLNATNLIVAWDDECILKEVEE